MTLLKIVVLLMVVLLIAACSYTEKPPLEKPGLTKALLTGRFDTTVPTQPIFGWTGSSIKVRFEGTGIKAYLNPVSFSMIENTIEVIIDGESVKRLRINADSEYVLASGLASGTHTAELYKQTEAFLGEVQCSGFSVTDGALLDPPQSLPRKIEFIGDSLTCGYGNEAPNGTDPFTAATENNYLAYSSIAARNLGAEHVTIAWSGKGIYRDYSGNTNDQLPAIYDRTRPEYSNSTWDFTQWTPDIVVINLGTNDFSGTVPEQALFTDAYKVLIDKIRSHYPDAFIYLAAGPAFTGERLTTYLDYLTTVITYYNQQNDTNIALVQFDPVAPEDGYGADWHPSLITHQKMADRLTTRIQNDFGW